MRRGLAGLAVVALLALLSGTRPSAADDGPAYLVIVNPANRVSTLGRGFVRDVYLKKVTEWKGGVAVRPLDLGGGSPARAHFVRDVIGKSPAQLRNYWSQRIFSGKGEPPPTAESPAAVIAYVLANPGAIGYIPADVDPTTARVVRLE